MGGSLALWYAPVQEGEGHSVVPEVELHFNLWRDLSASANFFDVGFLLTNVSSLSRFFLFLPGQIGSSQIGDLSRLLMHGSSLNAVFNDVIKIDDRKEDYFTTSKDGESYLTIHHLDLGKDLDVDPAEIDPENLGTVIAFNESFCERLRSRGDVKHYIRLRITFDSRTEELFSSELQPRDWWLLSSFSKTELTEFRLNERRSFPTSIADWADKKSFSIRVVHYFLIRDFHYELVMQHADFRKVRRLEGDLWRHYLRGRLPGDESGPDLLPPNAANRMVIYHWRQDAKKNENGEIRFIEDFIAFASFRSPGSRLGVYALAIALLGALGSAVQATLAEALRWAIVTTRLYFAEPGGDTEQLRAVDPFLLGGTTLLIISTVIFALGVWAYLRIKKRKFRLKVSWVDRQK